MTAARPVRQQDGPGLARKHQGLRGLGRKDLRPVAKTMPQTNPLAALGAYLGAHGLAVELTARGLKVTNKQVSGCCDEVSYASDTITCRKRTDDGGRLWFWNSSGKPIAEADRIVDAALIIRSDLSGTSAERGR